MRMLVAICTAGIFILALAVIAAGDRLWPLDLVTFFWPVLTLVAVALFLLAIPFGGTLVRLSALGAVALCTIPFLTLPPRPGDAPGEKIRILTANVFIANRDTKPFVALLTREQPDIVVMEETRPRFAEAVIGSGLYPFQSTAELSSTDDKIVFSRYPIRESRQLDDLPGQNVERHAMRLVIDSPAGPIVLYAIHPDSPRTPAQWHERNAYFERLAASVRAEPENAAVVIAGDWNLPAHSPYFRRFFAAIDYRFARPGLWLPVTRFATALARIGYFGSTIDHVAVSPAIHVTGWKVGSDIRSNHLPVIVDLALPSASALASRQGEDR